VPTDKRERQRAGKEARRAAARAAQQRAMRRRQIISVVVLVGVVVGIGLLINLTGKNDKAKAKDKSSTSTTAASAAASAKPGTAACPPAGGSPERKASFDGPPKNCLKKGMKYTAIVETDLGTVTIALDAVKAPKTVNNFVFLSRYHAYDGVPFHRVIPGFVVQGGDVELKSGTGGPGYSIPDELPKKGEYKVGSLAMANSSRPDSGGSQFFIITGDNGVSLPPQYSLFGMVTDGLDLVKKIEADGSDAGTPTVEHKIVKVTITETKG